LFFRQLGFRATSVLRSFYEDTPEDAFLMQFKPAMTAEESPTRRLAG
jgi:ribosomal-protein-alanine N-acetyltransferase